VGPARQRIPGEALRVPRRTAGGGAGRDRRERQPGVAGRAAGRFDPLAHAAGGSG
jgi:hypothetical protein